MKLLLCKNIDHLGIVGDIVDVAAGYGRNYLVPQGLATEPTETNMRKLAEARRVAEQDRIRHRKQLESLAQRLEGVEVTIRSRANEDGVLYGSVGTKEIAEALVEEGHPVLQQHVVLDAPLRHLDNVAVPIRLAENLESTVKVWVVREKTAEDDDADGGEHEKAGTEAAANDNSTGG